MKEVVRAIITNEQGKVLLGKRARGISTGMYTIIGGKSDVGEDPKEAVKREVKEEIGLDFEPTTLFLEREQEDDIFGKWRVFYFTGTTLGEIKLKEDEITEVIYVSEEEADSRQDIAFDHSEVLRDFFNKQK